MKQIYLCINEVIITIQERVELNLYFTLRSVQSLSAFTRRYRVFPVGKEHQGFMLTPTYSSAMVK